jgi:MoxR-like ATPase
MVVATQNPLEQQGTYPLPEAQLDRFLFKHVLAYPSLAEETAIVATHGSRTGQPSPEGFGVEAAGDGPTIADAVAAVATVRLTDDIVRYIVGVVRATRDTGELSGGASPRCAAMLAVAARARAALEGRDYVIPDDVKALALPALRHRVILSPAAEIEGRKVDDVVRGLVDQVEAPR